MYCPECGNEVGDAKFCPECGANLAGVQSALKGKTTGQAAGGKGGGQRPPREPAAPPVQPAKRGTSPAVIWGIFGAIAVVVIVAVVIFSGGFGKSGNGAAASSTASATPIMGVTTGTYAELVQKANAFYDKGDAAFQGQNFNQGSAYFQAAAMTYAAAWAKQKNDPAVGTDFATSLFYSGNIDAALKQINTVIKTYPNFQAAYFNLGNYLAHKARIAKQQGDTKATKANTIAAVAAYTKAVALDPASSVGKQADAGLKQLQP